MAGVEHAVLLVTVEVVPGSDALNIARYLADTTGLTATPAAMSIAWMPTPPEVTHRLRRRNVDGDRLAEAACDVLFFVAHFVWQPSREMPRDTLLAAGAVGDAWCRHARDSDGFVDTGVLALQSQMWRGSFTDSGQVVTTADAPPALRYALAEEP